jgi:hypothetical protein
VIRLAIASALAAAGIAAGPAALALAAPSVTIAKPSNGTVTNERTPTFVGTSDESPGRVTLRIYGGGQPEGTPVQPPLSTDFSGGGWSLEPLNDLPDGLYTARASQTNGLGETGSSAPVTFTINTAAPLVTLERPQLPAGDAAPSFSGTASDTTPVSVQIYAGGSTEGTRVALATAAGTGAGWHSSAATPALAIGRYTAVAVQKSSLIGNPTGRSAAVSFDVLPAPPAVLIAPPRSAVASQAARPPSPPALMAPFPVVRIGGVAVAGGLKLRLLKVQQAPAGALVRVRCHGRGCPRHGSRRITVAGPHGVPAIVFGAFERYLRAGAVVEVLVSKAGEIGKYTRLRVRRGRLPERVDECLDPAGVKPLACPAG